jgi:hypothetical protein
VCRYVCLLRVGSRSSSVGIGTWLQAGRSGFDPRQGHRREFFSSPPRPDGSEVHPVSYPTGMGDFIPWVKVAGA